MYKDEAPTIEEMKKNIGKTGYYEIGVMQFEIKVLDLKSAYGRNRYLIKPTKGTGENWVDISRVIFVKLP